MDREWKQVIVVIGIVAVLVIGGYVGVKSYSGMDNSLTVVVSGSMQHSDKSTIGVIDTGDMIIMKNKGNVVTYVDGYNSGYSTFGEYGDVVIYNRVDKNPVIHRAIIWLDYNGDGTFAAPSLKEKDKRVNGSGLWLTDSGNTESFTTLTLFLPKGGNNNNIQPFYFDSEKLYEYSSGYITKGDSINNPLFDCMWTVNDFSLVTAEQIKAVAGIEIPWMGSIKLYINGDTSYIQGNTPYCLSFVILDIIALLIIISMIWDVADRRFNKE